jgi:membrane fusion protein, heavy metal efflux system
VWRRGRDGTGEANVKTANFWMVSLAFIAITGCGKPAQSSPAPAASAPGQSGAADVVIPKDAKGIQTITVRTRTIPNYLQIPGSILPDPTRVVHVFAAAGGRLLQMNVRPWDHVEKGQSLALLESSDVSRAVSDYAKASVDAETKKQALDRANDLYAHHAIAQKDLEQAQADLKMAEAEVRATLASVHLLGVDAAAPSNQLNVLAPRAGIVLDIGAASGELSKSVDAAQPLCTIADLSTVWVEGDAFEQDAAILRAGTAAKVTLNAYPNESWTGTVAVVSDTVDPATRTMKVRVELPNPALRLKPNMFATVWLLRSSGQGISVPATAVVREGAKAYVFVATGNDRFERRDVVLGRTEDDNVQITSGLSAGTVIASNGALLLRDAASSDAK